MNAEEVELRRGVFFRPPSGWRRVDFGREDPTAGVKYVAPDEGCTLVVDFPVRRGSFEAHVARYRRSLALLFAGSQLSQERREKLGGEEVVRFSLSYGTPEEPRRSEQLLWPVGEVVVTAYYFGGVEGVERWSGQVESALETLHRRF